MRMRNCAPIDAFSYNAFMYIIFIYSILFKSDLLAQTIWAKFLRRRSCPPNNIKHITHIYDGHRRAKGLCGLTKPKPRRRSISMHSSVQWILYSIPHLHTIYTSMILVFLFVCGFIRARASSSSSYAARGLTFDCNIFIKHMQKALHIAHFRWGENDPK